MNRNVTKHVIFISTNTKSRSWSTDSSKGAPSTNVLYWDPYTLKIIADPFYFNIEYRYYMILEIYIVYIIIHYSRYFYIYLINFFYLTNLYNS